MTKIQDIAQPITAEQLIAARERAKNGVIWKIRQEIERRRKETTDTFVEQRKLHGEETMYWQGQKDAYGELLALLDSLLKQPAWKPTKEQMEALGDVFMFNLTDNKYLSERKLLFELYQDLKKL